MTRGRTNKAAWQIVAGSVTLAVAASLVNGFGCGVMSETGGASSSSGVGGAGQGGAGGVASSTSGSGVGGPPMLAAVPEDSMTDQCPVPADEVRPFELTAGMPDALLEGDTEYDEDDYSSYCGGGANGERNDIVYWMRAVDRGTLTLSPVATTDQPVVYVESVCGVRTTFGLPPDQLPCLDAAEQQIRLGVKAEEELYIIVEGDTETGDYSVNLTYAAPNCGDGVINPANEEEQSEQCDVGNGGAGGAGGGGAVDDGCDDNCRFDVPEGDEDLCPGIPTTVGQPTQGHTLGFADDYQPACAPAGGPDRLYYLALQQGDQLHLSVEADFDVVLAVMQECGELQPSHCQDSPGVSTAETLDFAAPSSDTYIIVVDGYDGASWGKFTLTATKS